MKGLMRQEVYDLRRRRDLLTYMRRSGSANIVEVGDGVQFHENPASRGITGRRDILDRTLLKRTIL